jgi:serine/threonine-protein kinase
LAESGVITSVGFLEIVVYVRCMLEHVGNGDYATAISLNNWHYVVWTFIIFIYGVFVPNTWQRTAAVLIPLATVPFLVDYGVGLFHSSVTTFIENTEESWTDPTPAPYFAAAIAIFAAHTLHAASVTAFKARRLGQYRILRLIGKGGMGRVYEAEHLLLKRACSVKLIHPEQSADDRALQRFQREVRAMAKLTHPHTIEVFDYGKTKEGVFFFAMELLPGMNLGDLVSEHGPLPPGRAVHFLVDVCDALMEAHAAGMIHRDIKPGNIFASQRGGICDFTKLLDFGLVRQIEVDVSQSLTAQVVAGTPSFMSPEQALRPDQLDSRCDLYAVGAVGYYLVSGRAVFEGNVPMEVMRLLIEQDADPESLHHANVPADLEAVLMRCLAKNREHRYQTARELRNALMSCACFGEWSRDDAEAWWKEHLDAAAKADKLLSRTQGDTLVVGETQA